MLTYLINVLCNLFSNGKGNEALEVNEDELLSTRDEEEKESNPNPAPSNNTATERFIGRDFIIPDGISEEVMIRLTLHQFKIIQKLNHFTVLYVT